MKVKEFISFMEENPEAEVNFYICDDESDYGEKISGDVIATICDPKEFKVFIPYNFLEGRI